LPPDLRHFSSAALTHADLFLPFLPLPPVAAMVAEGERAPDFTVTDSDGGTFKLSAVTPGRPVVLYFYPRSYVLGMMGRRVR